MTGQSSRSPAVPTAAMLPVGALHQEHIPMMDCLTIPKPPGPRDALAILAEIRFACAVDDEIERLAGLDEPLALKMEELAPAYAAGLEPKEAAMWILMCRGRRIAPQPQCADDAQSPLCAGPIGWVRWALADWLFRRALRRAGRA